MVWAGLETMPGGSKAVGTANERELEGYMTSEEALLEARRRWGLKAFAVMVAKSFVVGTAQFPLMGDAIFNMRGVGDSWEAAFAEADRRENGK